MTALLIVLLSAIPARAQTDEIQVYDGGLSPVGVFNLTWHNNFVASGGDVPPYPGAVVADHSFNGVTEWAYGVTDWFEAGLYLPLYSHDPTLGWGFNGWKLRALFAVPHADDRRFIYGANFEFSVNQPRWDRSRIASEVRPIVGWHLKPWDIILNPIVDTAYDGLKNLEFAPAIRVAYTFKEGLALAVEEYADYGTFGNLASPGEQVHQLYGVVNTTLGRLEIEAGAGVGLTSASDRLTFKLMFSRDLNGKKK